jgi:hypothetical protein
MPTMWLIAEGDSDPKVMQRILDEKGIVIKVKGIRPSGGAGIPRLAEELEDLLNGAIKAKKLEDCIVVLHDADEFREMAEKHRQHYRDIDGLCRSDKFKEKLCKYLKSGKPPSHCDSIEHPSEKLNSLIHAYNPKMGWNGRYWDDVLKNIDATGDKLSASMRAALKALFQLPCTKERSLKN